MTVVACVEATHPTVGREAGVSSAGMSVVAWSSEEGPALGDSSNEGPAFGWRSNKGSAVGEPPGKGPAVGTSSDEGPAVAWWARGFSSDVGSSVSIAAEKSSSVKT